MADKTTADLSGLESQAERIKDNNDGSWSEQVIARQQFYIRTAAQPLVRPNNVNAYTAQRAVTDKDTRPISIDVAPENDCPVALVALRINTLDTGPGAAPNAGFTAYIYNTDPTGSIAADGAVFSAPQAGLIGRMAGSFVAVTDGSFCRLVPTEGPVLMCKPAAGAKNIWVILRTNLAYTPSVVSAVYNHSMEVIPGHA